MRVSKKYKFVFISTPKCGTNTMFDLVEEHYDATRVTGNYHHTAVPAKYGHFLKFVICRNPYTRMVSLWMSTTQQAEDRYALRRNCSGNPDNFTAFVTWVTSTGWPHYLLTTQCSHLQGVRVDTILRLEHLADDFKVLPFFKGEFPDQKLNAGYYDYNKIMTVQAKSMIRSWAKCDFERFGYES